MSVQEGLFYLGGTLTLSTGLYLWFDLGVSLTAMGALLVFVAIVGEWDTDRSGGGR